MIRLRLTKIDEYQYLTCLKYSLWGSRSARFRDWRQGDYLVFIVDKSLAALAEVAGKPFQSKQKVWDKDIYPHRIPIKFVHVLAVEQRIPVLGEVRDALTSAWGPRYGWGILNQQVLTDTAAETIVKALRSRPNSLSAIELNIEQLLAEAQQQEEIMPKEKRKRGHAIKEVLEAGEVFETKEEESAHSKAQAALIRLGKITGCSVWIASNDRRRPFQGKPLGEGCLKSLPNLGLSEEATRHISFIDIIWIRQNTPVCAFEVETTTSIYSGLLRMADLLSVVPALNIKLFIIAPNERQEKVMAELSRPTFRKIGLSDFCKFIPMEELDNLLRRVEGLEGHVQPTILDTIAIEVEEEIDESTQ
ncbi:MAG: hypothetical protein CEE41_00655 [Hadesarchaea archaeon B3_Hades]|nr:MAG: hypothetical protein CEE41_00655 [Hadesarchaea archaeon B3_Hades]